MVDSVVARRVLPETYFCPSGWERKGADGREAALVLGVSKQLVGVFPSPLHVHGPGGLEVY